jgi:redox-sensitive bicupin YhaK (pirin superfamily)
MIQLRPGSERGRSELGWLDSYHTFSFDRYYDPRHMSFRQLRVLNEDWVQGGKGFPMHPHRDMEIITYILEGALEHRDSLGTGSMIRPGEVQRMSAGSGITHSEYNPSATEAVHLLQIWIMPARLGLQPGYEQKTIPIGESNGGLRLIAAPDGRDGAVTIHQDAEVYAARLKGGQEATHRLKPGRHAWVQVARGAITLNGLAMEAGDGAAVSQEEEVKLRANDSSPAELLLFDLS